MTDDEVLKRLFGDDAGTPEAAAVRPDILAALSDLANKVDALAAKKSPNEAGIATLSDLFDEVDAKNPFATDAPAQREAQRITGTDALRKALKEGKTADEAMAIADAVDAANAYKGPKPNPTQGVIVDYRGGKQTLGDALGPLMLPADPDSAIATANFGKI